MSASSGPMLVLFTGPPCAGKSTLAEAAAGILGAQVLGWDWAMAALTWFAPVQEAIEALDPSMQRRLGWTILTNLAEAQLRHGRSVILDGVARDEHVAAIRDLADHYDARSLIVLTRCEDRGVLHARTTGRRRRIPGWHELTWGHVGSYTWQAPVDVDHTVDTSRDPDPRQVVTSILQPGAPQPYGLTDDATKDLAKRRIRAVVFDVGETLVDETRQWHAEATRLGLRPLTFFAALGAVIERGAHHHDTWNLVGGQRPPDGFVPFDESDLYPDVLPCLRQLADAGLLVGIAGNQPHHAEDVLRRLDAPVGFVASSARWGVEKPSPRFFERICTETGHAAHSIAYVGDRLDNDILPAKQAGMFTVFIRRGPWGHIQARHHDADQPTHGSSR